MKKIKNKIFTGVLFLFMIIVLISAVGIIYINQLSHLSSSTIKNNYRSIDYATSMNHCLSEIYRAINNSGSQNEILSQLAVLNNNILYESNNITEDGESELVNNLQDNYQRLSATIHTILLDRNNPELLKSFEQEFQDISASIKHIYSMNMDAVKRKNESEERTAGHATVIMITLSILCLIITLPFIIIFPRWIVTPLKNLNEKIQAISSGEYSQKLEVNRNDEIGELASSFNVMSKKLEQYERSNLRSLLFEKKRLDSVIQNLRDGVVILDDEGRIIKMNRIALDITGLSESNVLNMPAVEIAMRNDLFRSILNRIYENHDDDVRPLKIAINGEEQYYSIDAINIIRQENGSGSSEIGKVILLNNVTLFQKRDAAKTNLIATVSHELKTPISSINLTLRLLDDRRIGPLNEEQKKLVQSLRQQSNRLSKVTNELLDFSQAETGNIKLNITSVMPEDIIDLSLTALMMIISEKNINLETEIQEGLPVVKADLEKTVWVLVNILANAVRFTPNGGNIKLVVKAEENFINFSVKDEGPGIPDKERNKVFEKYAQVGRPSSGTGLGLAIAKEFVQCQGGEIGVQNNPDKGSEFYFKLPSISAI